MHIRSGGAAGSLSSIAITIQDSTFASHDGKSMTATAAVSVLAAANVTITNASFSSNSGGALLLSLVQDTLVQSSNFTSNSRSASINSSITSSGGGAILSQLCLNTVILNSTFSDNIATNSGGAIHITTNSDISTLNVLSCTFERNKALFGSGGAMCVTGVFNITVNASSFTHCSAAVAGGSVTLADSPTGYASFWENTFTDSMVGVLPPGGWVSTADSLFSSNELSLHPQIQGGGGLFVSNVHLITLDADTFENCSSVRSKGGGVRIRACQVAAIHNSTFTGCSAAGGGAVAFSSMLTWAGSQAGSQGNTFTSNSASTQLECPTAECVGLDATLVGTQGDGGAISMDGNSLILHNINTFTSNSAAGRGGAVFAQNPSDSPRLQVRGDLTDLRNFTAPGGLPYLFRTSFVNNSALMSGGALALHGYVLSLEALLLSSPNAQLYTLFYGNTAPTGEVSVWA